jgi:hypothetical protein
MFLSTLFSNTLNLHFSLNEHVTDSLLKFTSKCLINQVLFHIITYFKCGFGLRFFLCYSITCTISYFPFRTEKCTPIERLIQGRQYKSNQYNSLVNNAAMILLTISHLCSEEFYKALSKIKAVAGDVQFIRYCVRWKKTCRHPYKPS